MVADESQKPRVETAPRPPEKTVDEAVRDMLAFFEPEGLPVYDQREEITNIIHDNDRIIIEAETGSGKSTVVPVLALAEVQKRNPGGKVVVTQPRRIAAEGISGYLGDEAMGDIVGFRHGGGRNITRNTQLEYTIERSLLNDLVRDETLSQYDTVILDEVHERKVDLDILIPLLKKAQEKRRGTNKPLKLILTSATLDREKMLEYFEGAVHKEVPGKMYHVEEYFEEEGTDDVEDLMVKAAKKASEIHTKGDAEPGDMLIFMPGGAEIDKTIEALNQQQNLVDDGVEFIPLSGGAESKESMRKIRAKSDKRRIFVSTNVAETSVTIDTVRVVIDSGLTRLDVFNPISGLTTLETIDHTKANAKQRKGRAGRKAPGTVHYLFTKEEMEARDPYLPAEILRTDLVAQVSLMKQFGITDIYNFDFIDHPGKEKIDAAIKDLNILGALNADGSLSDIGVGMTEIIDVAPRFARMMVEARRLGVEDAVGLIVAMLQNPKYDVFDKNYKKGVPARLKYGEFVIPGSDILTRLNIWNKYLEHNATSEERVRWEQENGLKTFALYNAANIRKQILGNRNIPDLPIDLSPEASAKITWSIAVGLRDKLLTKFGNTYQIEKGIGGITMSNSSVLDRAYPGAMLSGNVSRIRSRKGREQTYAGMNFTLSLEDFQKLTADLDVRWPPKAPIAPNANAPSPVVEHQTIKPVSREVTKSSVVPQPIASNIKASPPRLRDRIRSLLRLR